MKKLFATLMALCLCLSVFSFTACGGNNDNGGDNKTHTSHNWSATYTQDGDRHYQTCDGCDEKKYSDHDYTNGNCVCGKEKPSEPHKHSWSLTYTQDGDRHYQTCDGCDEKNYASHDYTNGNCVCGKEKTIVTVAVTGVTLSKDELTLEIGGEETLTATVAPDNATDKTVTWKSDKPDIASVDENGKITAKTAGTATITVTANNKTANCTVTVNAPITNADVINALNTYYKDAMLARALLGIIFANDDISNDKWLLTEDANDKITQAEYTYTLYRSDTATYYAVAKITFNTPVNVKDLVEKKVDDVTYSSAYRFGYNPLAQTAENMTICNAICDTLFGAASENKQVVARYIVDKGDSSSDEKLGSCHRFTVMEVTTTGVNESGINIKKETLTDTNYISKLTNEDKYNTYEQNSYSFVGTKIENNTQPFNA